MMIAKQDFLWYKKGEEIKDEEVAEDVTGWKKKGLVEDNVKKPVSEVKPKVNLDLDGDGDVDSDDAKIASKVMNKVRHSRKHKK